MRYNDHEKEINKMARQNYQDAKASIRIHIDTIKMLENHMAGAVTYLMERHDISYKEARQLVANKL